MKETPKESSSKRPSSANRDPAARTPAEALDGMSNRGMLSLLRQRQSARPADDVALTPPARTIDDVLAVPGQPLEPDVRRHNDQRFGHDFGDVRVHTDTQAADSARALRARAFTVGRDVVFSAGEYAPRSPQGSQLLAHELAHVIQQQRGGGAPALNRDADHERDADAAATAAMQSAGPVSVGVATGVGVARSPLDLFDEPMPDLSPWSNQTPNLKSWSVDRLETTLGQIVRWRAAQFSTSPQTELADTAAEQIRGELTLVELARAEAEAVFAGTEQTIKDDEDEEKADASPLSPRSSSLLMSPDEICQGHCITDDEIEAAGDTPDRAAARKRRKRTLEVYNPLEDIDLRDRYQEVLYRYPTDAAWRAEFDLDTLEQLVEERFPDNPPWLDREYFIAQRSAATWNWYQKLEFDQLKKNTNGWTLNEQAIALQLLRKWFELRNEGRTLTNVHQILIRGFVKLHEQQLRAMDDQILAECAKNPPGTLAKMHARASGYELCQSWFATDYSHGPNELNGFRQSLSIIVHDEDIVAAVAVEAWVQEYRKLTNPELLEQKAMAEMMVSGLANLGTPGGVRAPVPEPIPEPGGVPKALPPRTGPSPDVIQGGGQAVTPPSGKLSVVGPDDVIGAPYQPKTPPKLPPTTGGATGKAGAGVTANDNAPPVDQRQVATAGGGGGGDPAMTRKIVTPAPKPQVSKDPKVTTGGSRQDRQERNPIQEKTVKETPPPDDTHSVRPSPGGQQPLPLEAGNFAEKNFNTLPETFERAGIKSARPISEPIPANAKKFRIKGHRGYAPGREPEIDALDWDGGNVIEVKPHSLEEQGLAEAEGYAADMNELYPLPPGKGPNGEPIPRSWKPKCVTYDGEAMATYWDRVRPKPEPEPTP